MTLLLSIVICWISAQDIGMVQPPPLRSVMSVKPYGDSEAKPSVCFMTSILIVLGNNNSAGHWGRKWAPPPHRPGEASVWEGWGGHVSTDHTLFPWRSEEHQDVARQLGSTPCMVRLKGQERQLKLCCSIAKSIAYNNQHYMQVCQQNNGAGSGEWSEMALPL